MRFADVVVCGGGLAGSLAAAMLGRAGYKTILVDPHVSYPPDFRCEKLDGRQVKILARTGLAEAVLAASTHDREAWVARFGWIVDKRPSDQFGIRYDNLVNTVRTQIPPSAEFICAKVTALTTSASLQTVSLGSGEQISGRLIVMANGLNTAIRQGLGMTREDLSPCHSISIGFDIEPVDGAHFGFRALTYYGERPEDRIAYLTLFPIGASLRANLMTYREPADPWLRWMRQEPEAALLSVLPKLKKHLRQFKVAGPVKIRPADLYQTRGYLRDGIVLVGDALSTSCPAAGTGTSKVFTDVERLCNVYVPRWLAGDDLSAERMREFYDDPVKKACDEHSLAKAYYLRSLSTDLSVGWRLRRTTHFAVRWGAGLLRQARHALRPGASPYPSFGNQVPRKVM